MYTCSQERDSVHLSTHPFIINVIILIYLYSNCAIHRVIREKCNLITSLCCWINFSSKKFLLKYHYEIFHYIPIISLLILLCRDFILNGKDH